MSRPKLLLILDDSPYSTDLPFPPPTPTPTPSHHHQQPLSIPNPDPPPPFDSSIPLTIIVLLTALFFIAFFSLYLRCFSSPSPSSYLPTTHPSKSPARPHLPRSLPLVIYGTTCRQTDCVVCLAEFEKGESVKVIPLCRHVFHPECVDTWLSSHTSCPVCRSTQLS